LRVEGLRPRHLVGVAVAHLPTAVRVPAARLQRPDPRILRHADSSLESCRPTRRTTHRISRRPLADPSRHRCTSRKRTLLAMRGEAFKGEDPTEAGTPRARRCRSLPVASRCGDRRDARASGHPAADADADLAHGTGARAASARLWPGRGDAVRALPLGAHGGDALLDHDRRARSMAGRAMGCARSSRKARAAAPRHSPHPRDRRYGRAAAG
jgi:hypothetical protein